MNLKHYQQAALATLRRFLEEARITGPQAAYETVTREPELARRLGGYCTGYRPIPALPHAPYVCLRLPTGGGKTILAAHAVKVARDAWVDKDFPLVLWLTPTNTIRTQTAEALKNRRHPYRQALDEGFAGRVEVLDIADFPHLRSHDLGSRLCVVVGTIQTLRVSNTDGRKVYAHHEMLENHFTGVSPNAPGLERTDAGGIRFSFANLMHLHQPLVIMDEAHKTGSRLSREMYGRINPTALIEFTATPKAFNNILYSVSAQELKDEDMIKMPVMLAETETWQGAVNSAIAKRAELQHWAEKDRERYIRPIVLFQAEKKNKEVTVDVLKDHLVTNENIDPVKIAVVTGPQRELDGINLFDPACPIEYVITIEALKEGWDCSFAYVFCSVANIRNSTDAEQLLGRVLRMPYATRRKAAALNKSYARLVSRHFAEAAKGLLDRLVKMGFEEREAQANIEPEQLQVAGGLFGQSGRPCPTVAVEVDATPEEARSIARVAPDKITVAESSSEKVTVQISGFLKPREKTELYQQAPKRLHGDLRNAIVRWEAEHTHNVAPAQRGETLVVPRLMAHVQGELVFADTDVLMEYHDWSLKNCPVHLKPSEFDIVETSNTFEVDLDGNRLRMAAVKKVDQFTMPVHVEDWTEESLIRWLDRKLHNPFISQTDLLAWLNAVVTHLTRDRNIPLSQLMPCKFILARVLGEKIKACHQRARNNAYQVCLLGLEAALEVSFTDGFKFFDRIYADVPKYKGSYRFNKHFLGPDHVPAFDGAPGGEEEQCAMVIDSFPGVKYWTRNVARHPKSFSLPTSTDKFYPDFVALMKDGRLMVVEYKGKDRAPDNSSDAREKQLIGKAWARASGGKAVFVMATMTRKDPTEIANAIGKALGNTGKPQSGSP
ncbi:MAG: DEAD/DEAH box helicase family protein [Cyanobacteria bacterium MAG CAR2_bin_4]|nr:DEAD/DEAH box helicase family protein [Cyanobacteria bacterium MAG CAR2_bin_4]